MTCWVFDALAGSLLREELLESVLDIYWRTFGGGDIVCWPGLVWSLVWSAEWSTADHDVATPAFLCY